MQIRESESGGLLSVENNFCRDNAEANKPRWGRSNKSFSCAIWLLVLLTSAISVPGQEKETIHVSVALVQLNVAVTDNKGRYVTGLHPSDFAISEDGIPEKLAIFGEGNQAIKELPEAMRAGAPPSAVKPGLSSTEELPTAMAGGANVFILFDSSNFMYSGFVFAQDAISSFVRSVESADKIAFYSYSRNLLRATDLTTDRAQIIRGVRNTVAGADAALYNSLLLTVQDASKHTGRKIIIVFSNGPDNASTVPPEDVAELAQSAGVSIYIISTREARMEPVSTAVFERMTAATGGKAYFAKNWKDEHLAFASIRDDLAHLYSIGYYPEVNPNRGWRTIHLKLVGAAMKQYHIRTRNGYRPQSTILAPREAEELPWDRVPTNRSESAPTN